VHAVGKSSSSNIITRVTSLPDSERSPSRLHSVVPVTTRRVITTKTVTNSHKQVGIL
jgi:hypothetical protein